MVHKKLRHEILTILNSDVFRAMAAKWKKKNLSEVTDTDRQQVKQICYGILYGIGNKALSETLEICEEEANVFIFSFMKTYPGVRKFIDSVLADCKKNGYVKTIGGRRRYLPNIQSKYSRSLDGNLIVFFLQNEKSCSM